MVSFATRRDCGAAAGRLEAQPVLLVSLTTSAAACAAARAASATAAVAAATAMACLLASKGVEESK